VFFALVAIGIGWRLWMLTHYGLVSGGEVDVYLADEGVVGLMGKHIVEGRELPIFSGASPSSALSKPTAPRSRSQCSAAASFRCVW